MIESVSLETIHEYLGITLVYSVKGKVKVRMYDYVEKMIQTSPQKLKNIYMAIIPASNNIFENGNVKPLGISKSDHFHKMVAKDMFLSHRARPNINPMIYVLANRVRFPNIIDWNKLLRVLKYLNGKRKYHLTLSIYDMRVIKWYVDASFAVHPSFNSHTGGIIM